MGNRCYCSVFLTLAVVLLPKTAGADLNLMLHSEGNATLDGYYYSCASGALLRPTVDCVVVIGEKTLTVFELHADSLKVIMNSQFDNARTWGDRRPAEFVVGDFDGNGRDEIVLCLNKQLKRWEWERGAFGFQYFKFPCHIIECVSGDVFGDGSECLVTTSLPEPLSGHGRTTLRVNVSRLDSNGIDMVYDTTSDLSMTFSTGYPPDHLVCVGDIDNDGQTELVTSMAQSDMSSTRYRSYVWDSDSLSFDLKDAFSFGDNALGRNISQWNDWERDISSWVAGPFKPLVLYGETHLIAYEMGRVEDCPLIDTDNPSVRRRLSLSNYGMNSAAVILTMSDDVISCNRFRNDDVSTPNRVTYIEDADGSDRGLLVVTHEYFDRPWPDSEPVGWYRYFKLLDE